MPEPRRRTPPLASNSKGWESKRPPRHAGTEDMGVPAKGRGGFSTKVHLVCDSFGTILGVHVTPGQRHESKAFEPTLQRLHLRQRRGRPRWQRQLAGDKGYSYQRIWRWLQRRRITKVIPTRKDQVQDPKFNKETYRKRNIIERVVGWSKECRRLLTRFEKLAVNYLAFWVIASFLPLLDRETNAEVVKNRLFNRA